MIFLFFTHMIARIGHPVCDFSGENQFTIIFSEIVFPLEEVIITR